MNSFSRTLMPTARTTTFLVSSSTAERPRDARRCRRRAGPVRYVSHPGEQPMGIAWKLEVPLPAAVFERFAALLAA